MDTRSPLVVEDFIKDLGYEIAGRVKVRCNGCVLAKVVNEDGLVLFIN
jgi:hypothetical protein